MIFFIFLLVMIWGGGKFQPWEFPRCGSKAKEVKVREIRRAKFGEKKMASYALHCIRV